ncbi:MAG: Smc family protein [Bacteroidetes bacterium]|nr:Smc family protein [Bacteroidota bacterium]
MEDVIFNGTKARKPLGMAEVSLVIENTKGILPSDYTQVTITRRVYRSGESEYLLNRIPCRLKDILDLFMDTGMGADAYSVIELKMIETILSDKTDERRHLFEEAAGVTKYKHRRRAAYRKLDAVRADLVRVNDIVTEVQKAVNALERQARKAEQFHEVKARLRAMEVDLMERELAQYHFRAEPLKAKLEGMRQEKAANSSALAAEESSLDLLRDRGMAAEHALSEWQRKVGAQREKIHRVEEQTLVAHERTRALNENVARLEQDIARLEGDRVVLHELQADLRARIEELQADEARHRTALDERKAELDATTARLEARRGELQQLNDGLIATVHEIAELQTELDRQTARMDNLAGRIERAEEEIAEYEGDIVGLDASIAGLSEQDKALRRSSATAELQLFDAETRRSDLLARAEELRTRELELRGDIERRRARVEFLRALMQSREGLSDGARYLTASGQWGGGTARTVADAVDADDRFRVAVETALGEYAGCLLVDHGTDADRGIEILRSDDRGKATFLSIDRLPDIHSASPAPGIPGVVGWASDVARYDRALAPVFRLLLDGVMIVETPEAAARVRTLLTGVTCVTLDGEVYTGFGIVRGGSRRQDEGRMIGKEQQIGGLEAEIRGLEEELAGLIRSRDELMGAVEAVDLKGLKDAVKSIDRDMSGIEVRIAQVAFEKKRAQDTIVRNQDDIKALTGELEALRGGVERDRPAIDSLRERKADIERNLGALAVSVEGLDREWTERSAVVRGLDIALVTAQGELQNARNDMRRSEASEAELEQSLQRHRSALEETRLEIAATDERSGGNIAALEELRRELQELESGRSVCETDAVSIRDEIHAIELRIKDLRRTGDDLVRTMHDAEMKVVDLDAKADHLRARAMEEFEHTLELKSYPDTEFVDFASLRDEIHGLRDRVKTLGNINFAAFEEFSTEKQRLDFMSAQRNDLLEAEKTLLQTIEEINSTAQRKFLDTFEQIRKNFIDTFKSLFDPGDECDLKLEEGVDPLEARIEIVAKPRGKRPTSIDLLSGGEKTLTATALLFAIYLVKPSPFCILDEVDAPLDDANIDRFTRILRKFSVDTQFIVVTHNKRTMEAANALYGVTMEEEGVSKIVTVRFNQSAQVASAALASA